MIKKIKFVKMHGLGNDFVIVDANDLPKQYNLTKLAKNIANRHTGIGCDQFIIYSKLEDYYKMTIYNIDGSSAKLCGNASRCLAKLLYLRSEEKNITIKVGNKKLICRVEENDQISVNIEEVSFVESWMPEREKIWAVVERYMIDLKETICVDVGNPHLVIFSRLSNQDKNIIGEKLQDKELFKDGVNVNFAEVRDNKIYLSVWERGAGLTLACGSGACASFAASLKLGFTHSPSAVVFELGNLIMSEQNEHIIMQGPASLVASGEFYYD
ncbi:diaminopimelate epimerase [Rickettsia endosymbiont of Halotydeus destructor]|uniref:diaminopimelate epimerase n=1 Tax=Rickettsia endosymbiont of Halotydeus destructor TaxID=2996754 RepID=UPI003BB20ADB